jgi:hypothetical protein
MSARPPQERRFRLGWRRLALLAACAGVVAGLYCWKSNRSLPQARAEPGMPPAPPATTAPPPPAAPAGPSDYTTRIVAYLNNSEPITRQQLGDYLIARHGPNRLKTLINLRIIREACRVQGIEVSAGDVETALAEQLRGAGTSRERFLKEILKSYQMNLVEWKEDRLRPNLMLKRLCQGRATCSEEEVLKAFESAYGEKVQARLILWPKEKLAEAQALYPKLRDSEEAFDDAARHQFKADLASTAGKIKPIARYSFANEVVDKVAFSLRPGQVSELLEIEEPG